MSKLFTERTINIEEIFDAVKTQGLNQARKDIAPFVGSRLVSSGKITKISRRDGKIKLLIQSESIKIFADFRTNADFLFQVGRGQTVAVSGKFLSFGSEAICLSQCILIKGEIEK